MTDESLAAIFIGIPAYHGIEVLAETLRSIRNQTFTNWHAVISVDGNDLATAEIARPFLADPRLELVVQDRLLGWAGNLNALMASTSSPYFCYWQQDDICSTDYLERLYEHAEAHPFSACAYSDVQWFGSRVDRDVLPSVTGLGINRVLSMMEISSYVPFRGLVRSDAMRRAGPLRLTEFNSSMEDLIWVAKLAREGELHRVEGPLYYKRRSHLPETHATWHPWPHDRRRRAWIVFGLGFVEALWDLFPLAEKPLLLGKMAERLSVPMEGRWLFYDPRGREGDDPGKFAFDFFTAAAEWAEDRLTYDEGLSLAKVAAAPSLTDWDRMCCHALGRKSSCAELRTRFLEHGEFEVRVAAGEPGTSLLGVGWSHPELEQVWSDGPVARIDLSSVVDDEPTILTLKGNRFISSPTPDGAWRVEIVAGDEVRVCEVPDESLETEIHLPKGVRIVDLRFPDAASPMSLKESGDPRRLGLALTKIRVRRNS